MLYMPASVLVSGDVKTNRFVPSLKELPNLAGETGAK